MLIYIDYSYKVKSGEWKTATKTFAEIDIDKAIRFCYMLPHKNMFIDGFGADTPSVQEELSRKINMTRINYGS